MTIEQDQRLVEQALDSGGGTALRRLIDRLSPVVHVRVARALLTYGGAGAGHDQRQDVLELAQEVFLFLFEERARRLRAWDPGRGLSLDNFVGLLAGRQACAVLRRRNRNPRPKEALLSRKQQTGLGDPAAAQASAEQRLGNRELVDRVLGRLNQELSPLGRQMFQRLFVDEQPVAQICEEMSMKANAVYAWRKRLITAARQIRGDVMSELAATVDIP